MTPLILRLKDVKIATGISRSGIYMKIAKGIFPAPISLGGRTVGWLQSELDDWINQQVNKRDENRIK